jgi:outer membrane protein assembly factor BamB
LFPLPLITHGIVYVLTQDGHLAALRTSDGLIVWHVALQSTYLLPLLIETAGVIFVVALDGSVDALRESDGSSLWRYQGQERGPVSMTVAQGVIYLAFYATTGVNSIESITALRTSDGSFLWLYTPHVSAMQLASVAEDNLVLIALQDGSIDALRASNGTFRWKRAMNG